MAHEYPSYLILSVSMIQHRVPRRTLSAHPAFHLDLFVLNKHMVYVLDRPFFAPFAHSTGSIQRFHSRGKASSALPVHHPRWAAFRQFIELLHFLRDVEHVVSFM